MIRIIIGSFFSGFMVAIYIFSINGIGTKWYVALFGMLIWLLLFGGIAWSGVRSIRNKNKNIEVK
jgi:type IV secretory pathway TrbD component